MHGGRLRRGVVSDGNGGAGIALARLDLLRRWFTKTMAKGGRRELWRGMRTSGVETSNGAEESEENTTLMVMETGSPETCL